MATVLQHSVRLKRRVLKRLVKEQVGCPTNRIKSSLSKRPYDFV